MKRKRLFRVRKILILFGLISMALGTMFSSSLLFISIICIALSMIYSDDFDNFKACLILIPLIRVYDTLGVTYIVNGLIVLPVFTLLMKSRRVNKRALFHFFLLLSLEVVHIVVLNNLGNFMSNISAIFPLFFCEAILLGAQKDCYDITSASRWLSTGVVLSALLFLMNNPVYFRTIIYSVIDGARFSAYADDPNYYSLYTIMGMVGLLNGSTHKWYDYCILPVLVAIGLLTASKMCAVMMVITVLVYSGRYLMSSMPARKRFIKRILVVAIVATIVFRNSISALFVNLLSRLGGRSTNLSINSVTTGRAQLLVDYLVSWLKDPIAIVFGYGFQYRDSFNVVLHNRNYTSVAHNTFLDIILSWGIIGLFLMAIVVADLFFVAQNKQRCYRKTNKYPIIALMLMFMSLSCLSAGMFWYMITLTFLIAANVNSDVYDKSDKPF